MAGVKEEDLVEKHDIVFSKPMNFFLSTPYNTTFIEMRTDEIWPIPKDLYSDVYTFTRNGNNIGLLKTNNVHMDAIDDHNVPAWTRAAAVNNNYNLVDFVYCPGFNEGGSEVYIPSAFKIDLRLTRANTNVVCMGVDHADLAVANARLSLKDLKITIPIFKPKAQLSSALNTMFMNKEAKYYTTVFRTVTSLVPGGRRRLQENDVFNGSVPVRLFMLYSLQNNYNGTFNTNCFNFPWHNFSNIDVSVNSVSVGKITNQKEAYSQLRDVLNRKYSEMLFSYDAFIGGYALIAFDLTSNHDTHLAVLPTRPSGVVNVQVEFSANTAAGTMIFIGEFRNEIKVGLKTPARLLYDI